MLLGNVYVCSATSGCVNTGKNKIAKGVIEFTRFDEAEAHGFTHPAVLCLCVCLVQQYRKKTLKWKTSMKISKNTSFNFI